MSKVFKEIVTESAKLASVDEAQISIREGAINKWTSVAEFWELMPKIFDGVFYGANMHIALGRYPRGCDKIKPLLKLVEKALTTEENAIYGWGNMMNYVNSINKLKRQLIILDDYCEPMVKYIEYKFKLCTVYHSEIEYMDNLKETYGSLKCVRDILRIQEYCDYFEKSLKLLIPDADKWEYEQWRSQTHIFGSLETLYGVNYLENPDEFENLINMVGARVSGKAYHRQLFCIKDIPDSMVGIIWSTNIEKEISKQFLKICNCKPRTCKGDYLSESKMIMDSWAYKKLDKWRAEKRVALSETVKRNIFNFGIGLHPYLLKQNKQDAV